MQMLASASNFIKKESLAQVLSFEFCEIFKNAFFYRTTPVAASDYFSTIHIFLQFPKYPGSGHIKKVTEEEKWKLKKQHELLIFRKEKSQESFQVNK